MERFDGQSGFAEVATRHQSIMFRLYMEQPERMTGNARLRELAAEDRAQIVCDYIAGMTDRYAVASFDKHFVPKGVRGLRY